MNNFVYEASMEDSFIYKTLNSSAGLIEKIVKYIKTSVALDKTYWEEQYSQISKGFISPLCGRVLDAYNEGLIELLYSRDTKIGASIPFIVRKKDNKIVATIFISTFSTIDKSDNLTIPVKQLYALMECAYVALQMQINPMKVQRSVALMKLCSTVYVQMIMRILNKEYSLILDNVLYEKVQYCVARFFIEVVWGYPNKNLVDAYASNDLKYIDNLDLDMLKTGYENFRITDINKLIEYVKTLSPRMNELNIRYFIERFVNTYHGSALISLDYLPYTFFVIINVLLGSFLISQAALNDIIKNIRGMNKFYMELSKLV